MASSPPTTELGTPTGYGTIKGYWQDLNRQVESVPEMRWPRSVRTVIPRMLADVQVGGLYRATILPQLRFNWYLELGDADADASARLADDLGLPLVSGNDRIVPARVRSKARLSWTDFQAIALDALAYGNYAFEQVGMIDQGWFRLTKLAERPPWTIEQFLTAPDGGLDAIRQFSVGANGFVDIPIDRLVMFTWAKRGGNWTGRSILRELFTPWLIKNDLVRVDAVKHRRNGMGVPFVKGADGDGPAEQAQGQALAQAYRVGDAGGGYLPPGTDIIFKGVEGQVPDTIGSVRYHDESMARNMVLMVMQLGQTRTGSRALSRTFADMFSQGIQAFSDWFRRVVNAHIIEDWFDWNLGPQAPIPELKFDAPDDPNITVSDLKDMVDGGLITVDAELEDWIRLRHRMPARVAPFNPEPPNPPLNVDENPQAPPPPAQARRLRASLAWPRAWRRDLTDDEIASGVDFAALDQAYHVSTDDAVAAYLNLRSEQVNELADQIRAGSSPEDLAAIQAAAVGQDAFYGALSKAAQDGVNAALDEAFVQGVDIAQPTPNEALLRRQANATADLLAGALSEVAARKAVQLAHDGVGSDEVATRVADHVRGLSDQFVRDQVGGAVTAALNHGRELVFAKHQPEQIIATELLDANVCAPCRAVDGKHYASLEEAQSDYPTGGFHACLGGVRCRGSIIVIWPKE